jgi:hypothetical protein
MARWPAPVDRHGRSRARDEYSHSSLMYGWSDAEWLTLQLCPGVISALMGRNRFDELEHEAFWQAVEEALSSETTCLSRACDLKWTG